MKIHSLIQSSLEWLAFFREHFNVSNALAMRGISPWKSRGALLAEKATGIAPSSAVTKPHSGIPPEYGDLIRDFLKSRDFGKGKHKIRAALAGFCKFALATPNGRAVA